LPLKTSIFFQNLFPYTFQGPKESGTSVAPALLASGVHIKFTENWPTASKLHSNEGHPDEQTDG
jgi:hypothetical protein